MKWQVWPTHSWSGTEPTEVNVTIIIIILKNFLTLGIYVPEGV